VLSGRESPRVAWTNALVQLISGLVGWKGWKVEGGLTIDGVGERSMGA
jgi:hypothetical protein